MSDVLVLGYHAVSESWSSDLSVTPGELERQLSRLVRRGYRGARFDEAVSAPSGGKTLAVTFDDAYRSVLELAHPVMEALELPGTVFAPTGYVDRRASWSGVDVHLDGPHADELDVMSWEELRRLSSLGWEIGSHTRSHPWLTRLDDATLMEELDGSRAECERELGESCLSIAYPYGDTDERVAAAAGRAGYRSVAGLPASRRFHAPRPHDWPRVGIFHGDGDGALFKLKVSHTSRRVRALTSRLGR
jgi:peptidoglycan/xylan/chitin deacetylase (PgdA/CDA1 family)